MPEEATSADAANGAVETAAGAADIIAQGGGGDVWYSIGSLLDKGGPIVAILLVLSVISAAIILLKIVQFWTAGLSKRSFVDPAVDKVEQGDLGGALEILRKHKTPLARAMAAGVRAKMRGDLRDEDVAAEIQRVGTMELGALQRYLRWLEVIGNISPLLGLLGTVIGMINAFQSLEAAGTQVDPALLSGERFDWRTAWSAVAAVGVRPCSGALIVLTFSFLNGLWLGGIVSVLAMSIGTAITVATLATLAVTAKNLAVRMAGDGRTGNVVHASIEIGGAALVFLLGLVLLTASLQA